MPVGRAGPGRPTQSALCALLLGAGIACHAAATSPVERSGHVPAPVLADAAPDEAAAGGEAPDTEARVALGPGGRDVRLAGDLTEGVAARVAALLAENRGVERIHLTSDGGLVEEAQALGALVAAHGLATYVPDACASACTLAFVRGRSRYLAAGGRLGFHAPYEARPGGRTHAVESEAERIAYLAAGVAPDFVARALAVSPDDIWIPDTAQLRAAGVVTDIVGSERFPDSTLDADPSLPAARAEILRNLPVLEGMHPAAVEALAAWFLDGYRAGRTEADAIEGLRRQTTVRLRWQLRRADDAALRALGQAILAATRLPGAGRAACAALVEGDLVTLDETLRRARPGSPGLAPALARSVRRGGAPPDRDRDPARKRAAGPLTRCGALIEATRRALGRPPHAAALALRTLLAGDPRATLASAAAP